MRLSGKTIGFALAGSHCTLEEAIDPILRLKEEGADIVPIVSNTILTTTTRFGSPEKWLSAIREATGKEPLKSIPEVEPLGPQKLLDAVVICPCTGNTLARLANAITDSPVLMAAKAQLRNGKPVVLAITSNDILGLNARNLGTLLITKNVYFVPFGHSKPIVRKPLRRCLRCQPWATEGSDCERRRHPIALNEGTWSAAGNPAQHSRLLRSQGFHTRGRGTMS
ncbi:MAG: dipicolinate synthase subunit B [Thermaerobacter sp.]|nr:dipicolinate synthase subunit B [Thermaerobacter sp.]